MVSTKDGGGGGEREDNESMAKMNSLDFTEDDVNICGCHILPIYDIAVLT